VTVLSNPVAGGISPAAIGVRPIPHPSTRGLAPDLLASRPFDGAARPVASIILPAYNEEHGIAAVLRSLRPVLDGRYEVIVVDDGSTDRTALVAELWGARVVRHEVNRGKGAALRTGFQASAADHLVTLDADGTYPVRAIPELVRLLEHGHGMAIGTRRGRGSMSPVNRMGNHLFRTAISVTARRRVRDPLSGMYGLRRDVVERLDLRSEGFGIETEIVIKAARAGASIVEIPIEYAERIGESKLNPWRDGLVISRTIATLLMRSPRVTRTRATGPVARS
jgi:glycosyltransferase involved in cell wall biosynthesis